MSPLVWLKTRLKAMFLGYKQSRWGRRRHSTPLPDPEAGF